MTITTEVRTLDIDTTEVESIVKAFKPYRVKETVIPQGFFTAKEMGKMLHLSSNRTARIMRAMIKDKKAVMKRFTHYKNGRPFAVVYYKLEK